MATSKKPSASKIKPAKSKAIEPKIEDAVTVEDEVSVDAAQDDTVEAKAGIEADETAAQTEALDETSVDDKPDEVTLAQDTVSRKTDEPERAIIFGPVTPQAEVKQNTFLPLVLGGIVAGVIGFMAAEMNIFSGGDADITTKLRSDLNSQQERLVSLESAEAPQIDLTSIQEEVGALEARLTVLEERPAVVASEGDDAGAAAAYATEFEALKLSVEEQRSEIAALLSNAKSVKEATADAAKAASGQAAIAKIVSAIDAGQPFVAPLADLQALDIGEIDPALSDAAAEGVTTLSALQAEFPDQARTALAAARASSVADGQQGIGGFLTRALGARSVAPREGNDPDAVLSRAEAAVKTGDLNTTLIELDALPEEAQAAIADWRAAADARVAARAAADALAQRLTAD